MKQQSKLILPEQNRPVRWHLVMDAPIPRCVCEKVPNGCSVALWLSPLSPLSPLSLGDVCALLLLRWRLWCLLNCSTASLSLYPGSGKENQQENISSHLGFSSWKVCVSYDCVDSSQHLFITVTHALLDSKGRFSTLDERKMSPFGCFDSNF